MWFNTHLIWCRKCRYNFFTFTYLLVVGMRETHTHTHTCATTHIWRSDDNVKRLSSFLLMWIPGIKLRSLDLVAGAFPCLAMSSVGECRFLFVCFVFKYIHACFIEALGGSEYLPWWVRSELELEWLTSEMGNSYCWCWIEERTFSSQW